VDADALAPEGTWEARRARSAELRILWTRQLEAVYDPDTLLRALGILARRGIPFRATLAGTGSRRRTLESAARAEGVAASVRFLGWLEPDALAALYRAHDVYVSLSRSDSTSQSLLEAMAAGLLPVVSDIEGNREWVTHRRHGLLVPAGDEHAAAAALAEAGAGGAAICGMADASRAEVARRASFADTVSQTEERLLTLAGRG
jgi:glycosyltransferase involved in cell wall biosynthesis